MRRASQRSCGIALLETNSPLSELARDWLNEEGNIGAIRAAIGAKPEGTTVSMCETSVGDVMTTRLLIVEQNRSSRQPRK